MKLILCFIATLFAQSVSAENLLIRGGEHDDFTRITVPIRADTAWSVQNGAGQFILHIPGARIDTSYAMERLNAGRVTGITVVPPDAVLIRYACDCSVADQIIDGLLVFDIAPRSVDTSAQILPVVFDKESEIEIASPEPQTDRSIAASIERAADQGLLTLNPDQHVQTGSDHEQADVHAAFDDFLSPVLTGPANNCVEQTLFRPIDWGMTGDFTTDLTRQRSAIVPDIEGIASGEFIGLTQLYIYYGLFAEAQVNALQVKEDTHWSKMANLLNVQVDVDYFERQKFCSDDAALYAAIAGAPILDSAPILRAIRDVPRPLRRSIGPKLIESLMRANEVEAARSILEWVDASNILNAHVMLQAGDYLQAHQLAKTVIDQGDLSIGAYLIFLSAAHELQIETDLALLDAIEVTAFEHRGTEQYDPLVSVLSKAYAISGDIVKAVDLAGSDSNVLSSVFEIAVERASNADFLRVALSADVLSLDEAVQKLIDIRLGDLGFGEEQPMVALPQPTAPTPSRLEGTISLSYARDMLERAQVSRERIAATISQ